jgi:hypothetical protein
VGVEAKRGIVNIRGEAISTVKGQGQRGRGLTEVGGIMRWKPRRSVKIRDFFHSPSHTVTLEL